MRALLAVLALVSQLALGAMLLPDAASARGATRLDAVTILCTTPLVPDRPSHHHPRPADRALFPLDAALALQAVLLPTAATMPPPPRMSGRARPDARPPARGPPARLAWSLHVRGPPVLA